MGEIADAHVEAYAAGLDPTDMDGADWADFYAEADDFGPLSEEDHRMVMAEDFRLFVAVSLRESAQKGEAPADTLRRLFPQITEGQAAGFVAVLDAIWPHEAPEEYEPVVPMPEVDDA